MIKFYCFHCGTKISAEPEHAGATASCPTCGQDLVVPADPGSATPPQQLVDTSAIASLTPVHEDYTELDPNENNRFAPRVAVAMVVIIAVATGAFVVMKVSSGGAEKPVTVHSYQPIQSQKIANLSDDDDLLEAGFTLQQIRSLKQTAANTGSSWAEVKRLALKSMYPEDFREVEREQRLQKIREIERERSR